MKSNTVAKSSETMMPWPKSYTQTFFKPRHYLNLKEKKLSINFAQKMCEFLILVDKITGSLHIGSSQGFGGRVTSKN